VLINAAGLVPCDGADCTIPKFFEMLVNIYRFIVFTIAVPLGIIALSVAGVMILISAGNPGLANKGKSILWLAIIGLTLALCSWLIINFILTTLGYKGNWDIL